MVVPASKKQKAQTSCYKAATKIAVKLLITVILQFGHFKYFTKKG